jgi:hypothetical protein
MQTCKLVPALPAVLLTVILAFLTLGLVAPWARGAQQAGSLAFRPDESGGFRFDTGVLRGQLRPGGKTLGLCSLVHVPSGIMLDRGEGGYGIFSHYRVFTTNKRYGKAAWDWPSSAHLRQDGAVEVTWNTGTNCPFGLRAIYRWTAADTLDLETIVEPIQDLPNFESFLASYFAGRFSNALVYVTEPLPETKTPDFLAATREAGVWQMFPRDAAVLSLIRDGRWQLEPNPVAWTNRPALARPIGLRRDPASGITAALMAPSEDCFAIATPHQTEGHYSLYLSLFGRNLKAGEPASARARLLVLDVFSKASILDSQQALAAPRPHEP